MSVPVLVVTGFLGAGKTTLINQLLQSDHGLRIAAIVNDFGAINIDAALIGPSAEGVIGLRNGCICCSIQGDLLRTLKVVLRSAPELIVIEASGVADPAGIVESLMDPVIWQAARLQTVACVVDAIDAMRRLDDPLWQAQTRGSDILVLAKEDAAAPDEIAEIRERLASVYRKPMVGQTPALLKTVLLDVPERQPVGPTAKRLVDDRFAHVEWSFDGAIDLAGFQGVMGQLAPDLLRAKGFLRFRGQANAMLFQLSGRRATLERAPAGIEPACRLVLIGESDAIDRRKIMQRLASLETSVESSGSGQL